MKELKEKSKKKIVKIVLSLAFIICTFMITNDKTYALSFTSTYSDTTSTSSQAINLLNYAYSYDSFKDKDYVIFTSEQYNYYIVWGDLSYSNGVVSGSDIEYIHYYRIESSGYNSNYTYDYGTDNTFSLKSAYVNTSNISNYGFSSQIFEEYKFNDDLNNWFILIGSMFFAIMLCNLRRS